MAESDSEQGGKPVRFALAFTPEGVEQIDRLKAALGFESRWDVIRLAMGLLINCVEHLQEGWELVLSRGGEEKTITLPLVIGQRE